MIDNITLGQLIKKYRKQAKLTQDSLSQKLEVRASTVAAYEQDRVKDIPLDTLADIQAILKIPIEEIPLTPAQREYIRRTNIINTEINESLDRWQAQTIGKNKEELSLLSETIDRELHRLFYLQRLISDSTTATTSTDYQPYALIGDFIVIPCEQYSLEDIQAITRTSQLLHLEQALLQAGLISKNELEETGINTMPYTINATVSNSDPNHNPAANTKKDIKK